MALINPLIELAPDPTQVSTWVQNYSRSNLILIGGPVYNAASGFYQVSEGAHYTLLRGPAGVGWRVQSRRGITPGDPGLTESRAVRRELAFIQRIIRTDTGTYITTLVGTGAAATLAGADRISRNYRQLDKRCGRGEFGILLAFPKVPDPEKQFSSEISVVVLDEMFDGRRGR